MVCRQLHDESKSQRVPKPILTIHGSWCDAHTAYCVLKDVSILRIMGQFSALNFEDMVVRKFELLCGGLQSFTPIEQRHEGDGEGCYGTTPHLV